MLLLARVHSPSFGGKSIGFGVSCQLYSGLDWLQNPARGLVPKGNVSFGKEGDSQDTAM